MSRSGYSEDIDNWDLIRWRGAVKSALRGRPGQAFLRETLAALDALPDKKLTHSALEQSGEFCVLGAVGAARGTSMAHIDPEDHDSVAGLFKIPHSLACEIMFMNDEAVGAETPEQRYTRMRQWVLLQIKEAPIGRTD